MANYEDGDTSDLVCGVVLLVGVIGALAAIIALIIFGFIKLIGVLT